jgi:protein-S-isoprenylcysteine O-methyltransferase Ste14
MPPEEAATASAPSRKSTGALKAPTGSLRAAPELVQVERGGVARPLRRDFRVRLAELAIYLAAIIGVVALGLGISEYLGAHPYVAAYLTAYAAFRLADLLVRDEATLGIDGVHFGRRMMYELPLLLIFFSAPFERTYIYGGEAARWLGALGLLIELAGLWLALGARIQLGFFSPAPAAGAHAVLVRSGLYAYVRHPIYLGEFLVLIGWPLEYGAPITLVVTLIIGVAVILRRVRNEEADLLAQFGDEYAGYMRETDSLIPNIW